MNERLLCILVVCIFQCRGESQDMSDLTPASWTNMPRLCQNENGNASRILCNDITEKHYLQRFNTTENDITLLKIHQWKRRAIENYAFCNAIRPCAWDIVVLVIDNSPMLKNIRVHSFHGLDRLRVIKISNTGLKHFVPPIFHNLKNLEVLNIQGNQIGALKNNSDKGATANDTRDSLGPPSILPSLKLLRLDQNPIKKIEREFFQTFDTSSLQQVYMRSCELTEIERGSFLTLQNISLDLYNNSGIVPYLSNAIGLPIKWSPYKHVIKMYLHRNNMDFLSIGNLFSKYISLKVASLDGNNVGRLSSGWPVLKDMGMLSLNKCNISSIEANVFLNWPSLHELHLKYNLISVIPVDVVIPSLRYLDLNDNPITDTSKTLMTRYLPNLRQLTLNRAQISTLHKHLFSDLANLTSLKISETSLHSIEDYTFDNTPRIKDLDLSDNNQLVISSSKVFAGLSGIVKLNLAVNFPEERNRTITVQDPFATLNSLEFLNLTGHNFSYFNKTLFWGLFHLKHLIVRDTLIEHWENPLFKRFPVIETIDLSRNMMTELSDDLADDLSAVSISLDLSQNPFICSCTTLKNFKMLMEDRDIIMTGWGEGSLYTCTYNESMNTVNIQTAMEYYDDMCPLHQTSRHFKLLYLIPLVILSIALALTLYQRQHLYYLTYLLWARIKRRKFKAQLSDCLFDAFVCYCERDSGWVIDELVSHLETKGLTLCLHERDFVVGKSIVENIVSCIERSRKIILLMSKNFVRSQWCMFEVEISQQKIIQDANSNIIVINLDHVPSKMMPTSLKYLVKTKTHITWTNELESQPLFWVKLNRALKKNDSSISETV